MRRFFIFLIMFCIPALLFSQNYVPTKEDLEKFMTTRTLVVLDSNPLTMYNHYIKEVMENEWTITEYEFIGYDEFGQRMNDPGNSFLHMSNVSFERDKLKAVYKFLLVSLGGAYRDYSQMPDIVSVPAAYKNVDEETWMYKLGILVRFIQNHIRLIYENPDIISKNVFRHYNENTGEIKQKVLYLIEDELSPQVNSPARISEYYPHPFKIVDREEVRSAIEERKSDVVFLHKVGPEGTRIKARCYKIIIGAEDARFYYFDYHTISDRKPDGLTKKDFKKLAR